MTRTFTRTVQVDAPVEELFAWHARPGAFERLTPPWERIEILERHGGIRDGDRTVLRVKTGPIWRRWVAEHRGYRENEQFQDVQVEGPFGAWTHTHAFEAIDASTSALTDSIEFSLPVAAFSGPLFGSTVERRLGQTFRYRHETTQADLRAHQRVRAAGPRTVLVSGATGLVGRALCAFLTTGGHTVRRLVRREPRGPDEFRWSGSDGRVDPAAVDGADCVVHLAGESIAHRWTDDRKARIRDSRVRGTEAIVRAMLAAPSTPSTFLCASAIGYYGDCGDRPTAEDGAVGGGFLADVVREWEATAAPVTERTRTASLRFGVILSPQGGALAKMAPIFKLGGGGRIGSGRQVMSWVSIDDVVAAIHHAMFDESMCGPINVVAPEPVTNLVFTNTLGRVLRRPSVLPLPTAAARTAFGEMANETLLASCRVVPRALTEAGFSFRHPTLEACLHHLLGRG